MLASESEFAPAHSCPGSFRPHAPKHIRRNSDSLFTMSDNKQSGDTPFCETTHSRTDWGSMRTDWWSQTGSNRRPHACKARALPTELWPLKSEAQMMVGLGGLEPPTSRLSSARSNQLSYKPPTATLQRAPVCTEAAHACAVLVREERETKTAVSRQMPADCRLMFQEIR